MTPDSNIRNSENSVNDATVNTGQNSKTVECQLRLTYQKLAAEEARIHLFSTLKSMDLSTNDVTSFINGQTIHKRVLVRPDVKVQKAAMNSKLLDSLTFARKLRRRRDMLKKKLCRKYQQSPSKSRKICSEMVDFYHDSKKVELRHANNKIERIKIKSLSEKVIKKAPESTQEFLSHVNVFSQDQYSVNPEEPKEPFICSKDIELSANERKILARGPNFMVRDPLDIETFSIELEKAIAKRKYESMFKEKEDDSSDMRESAICGIRAHSSESSCNGHNSKSDKLSEISSESDLAHKREVLWEEQSGKMVFNYKSKTLDLGNLKATDYKHNKYLCMPDPESSDLENLHQFRRTECNRIFKRALKSVTPKTSSNLTPKVGSEQSNVKAGSDRIDKKSSHTDRALTNPESNLSRDELLGLESLRKKIKSGQLLIADTDKSKRFCALTPEQYSKAGEVHTDKDIELVLKKLKESRIL